MSKITEIIKDIGSSIIGATVLFFTSLLLIKLFNTGLDMFARLGFLAITLYVSIGFILVMTFINIRNKESFKLTIFLNTIYAIIIGLIIFGISFIRG